ncbi:hypothetical protein PG989_014521 [Apiospora arundinis]
MDIASDSSDDSSSSSDSYTGETDVVNQSHWNNHIDDSNESAVPETVSSLRDNGEGPSRLPMAAGGSPDDDGDGPDDDDSENGSDDSGYASDGKSQDSDEGSDDDDTVSDLSVMPDVIEGEGEDFEDEDEDEDEQDDPSLWSFERLQVEYRRQTFVLQSTKQKALMRIRSITQLTQDRINGLREEVDGHLETIVERDEIITDLGRRITQLQSDILELQNRLNGIRPPPTPWTQLWQAREPPALVYKESCKQLNMSQVLTNVHPQLTLSVRILSQQAMEAAYNDNGGGNGNGNGNGNVLNIGPASDSDSELFVRQDSPLPPVDGEIPRRPFNFNGLDRDIQERIFRYLFVKTNLVHCLSRLDPGNRPLEPRPPHRFFWGKDRDCIVTLAHRPNSVLRLLLVCKRWLYLGVHAFYGLNTFAFSSLGELGRFMKGIGSRLERIVNVELFWHGAIMPRHPSRVNQRTLPLQFFCDTRRLKTLIIHLQELDERRTRRKHEIQKDNEVQEDNDGGGGGGGAPYNGSRLDLKDPFRVLVESTRIQPNNRQYRSIRTMHGLDFVYQLRGMNYVRIREAQGPATRENIRDWSAVDDINAVVTRPKAPDYEFASELDNLSPIRGLGDFVPTEDDKQIVRRWYADDDPMGSVVGEDDDGDTISIISSAPSLSDDSDDGSDDDPNTLSDNDSGVDVDMGDKTSDIDVDSGVEDMDEDPMDDINDGIERMSVRDESESIDNDANDETDDCSSITTEDSDPDDDDDSSRPQGTGITGITSDYSTAVNATAGLIARRRSTTVSSSTADVGDDADDVGVDDDDSQKGDSEKDEGDARSDDGSDSSSLFVAQINDDSSSLFVASNRASTYFKTDSDEEKKIIIDLTSDNNAGPSKAAGGDAGNNSDESTDVKNESSSSVPRPVAGSSRDAPVDVDAPDDNSEQTIDFSEAESVSSSWKDAASSTASFKRRDFSPYPGIDSQRTPKRMRYETPSESGGSSEEGSSADAPISLD